MKKVSLIENIFDVKTIENIEVEDICVFLFERFNGKCPKNLHIYNKYYSKENEITPHTDFEVKLLNNFDGPFIVVIEPGYGYELIAYIVVAVISIGLSVYSYLSQPSSVSSTTKAGSSNNSLSDRSNKANLGGRIEDIFGEVRSVPTIICSPYHVFEDFGINNREVEYGYYCIGRGSYAINDAKEDTTLLSSISGASAQFYDPYNWPNGASGHNNIKETIGDTITVSLLAMKTTDSINGQTLYAPNYKKIASGENVRFTYTGYIDWDSLSDDYQLSDIFDVGDDITISGASYTNGVTSVNLDGVYTIYSIDDSNHKLKLSSPSSENADWNKLSSFSDQQTGYVTTASVFSDIDRIIGPYLVGYSESDTLLCNFTASNGLYKINSKNKQLAYTVTVAISRIPCDSEGNETGSEIIEYFSITGSKVTRSFIGKTHSITVIPGYYKVSAWRISNYEYGYNGQIQDDIVWRDLYSGTTAKAGSLVTDFGNITTVYTRTIANSQSVKGTSRKLNMLATRKVPLLNSDGTLGALTATKKADSIFAAICLDEKIGKRTSEEVDLQNIYQTVSEIISYFGIDEAAEFCTTFDNRDTSPEDTIKTVASAIFCSAYRENRVLKLFFEKQANSSSLLFNSRNIEPKSMTIEPSFGLKDNCDGIELTYVVPDKANALDTSTIFYLPTDMSAKNPQSITMTGVRNYKQAYLQAWRKWNKIRFQNITCEFNATQMGELVIPNDRILIADITRQDTQEGEILAQNGLTITLSEPFIYTTLNHTIHLQLRDGSIQSINIASTSETDNHVISLASAPSLSLVTDNEMYAKTTYVITEVT